MDVPRLGTPESWSGQAIAEWSLEEGFDVQIVGLYRREDDETHLAQPTEPTTVLQGGDIVALTGTDDALRDLEATLQQE